MRKLIAFVAALLLVFLALPTYAAPADIMAGDHVLFGRDANGVPIEWRVLECGDGNALIVSEGILNSGPFSYDVPSKWASSFMRQRCQDMYDTMFSEQEKAAIINTYLEDTDTYDHLFALSEAEVHRCFSPNLDRIIYWPDNGRGAMWWMRDLPDQIEDIEHPCAKVVAFNGTITYAEANMDSRYADRPAMVVDLSAADFKRVIALEAPVLSVQNYRSTTVRVSWEPVRDAEIYELISYEHGSGIWEMATQTTELAEYVNVKPGKYYYFAIRATNVSGGIRGIVNSAFSDSVLTRGRPAAPDTLTLAANKKGQISIKWNAAGESGIMYRVVRHEDGSGKGWVGVKLLDAANYTDKNVKSGKTYRYRVHAYKNIGGKNVFSCYSDALVVGSK